MSNKNYQSELDQEIQKIQQKNQIPSLLLHSCCAPCSSYCLTYLAQYFRITVFFYNPNIEPETEYIKRLQELKSLIQRIPLSNQVELAQGRYEPEKFQSLAKGREMMPERGERCYDCYELRQRAAAKYAKEHQFDYFTTTLSVSPHKNADWLNEIGLRLSREYQIPYLVSDFKKRGGYQQSITLSSEYNLYRQDYCGCIYSKQERERQRQKSLEI